MPEDFGQDDLTRSYAAAARLDEQAASVLAESRAAGETAAVAGLDSLCSVWQRIRPIVKGASELFLIPSNIRRVLKELINVIDGLCPG